jgi:hypothetical protein
MSELEKLQKVEEFCKELNQLQWQLGADEGWGLAVNAIKKELEEILNK